MRTKNLLLALFLVVFTGLAQNQLADPDKQLLASTDSEREVLYLPNGNGIEFLSFGYRNFFSDLLWFKTIDYFGKHYASDKNYKWLSHMCHLVSALNPRAQHVYKFCNTMLTWEAEQPELGTALLTLAIQQFPEEWEYYYLRGFNYLFFLHDEKQAEQDMAKAATLPNAPVVVQRLAAKKMAVSDPTTAITFLQDMIRQARDDFERKALADRLSEAVYERDARTLEQGLAVFNAQTGRKAITLDELVSEGIVSGLDDPFGGTYQLNENGQVVSSTGRERLRLYEQKEDIRKKWESLGNE